MDSGKQQTPRKLYTAGEIAEIADTTESRVRWLLKKFKIQPSAVLGISPQIRGYNARAAAFLKMKISNDAELEGSYERMLRLLPDGADPGDLTTEEDALGGALRRTKLFLEKHTKSPGGPSAEESQQVQDDIDTIATLGFGGDVLDARKRLSNYLDDHYTQRRPDDD